MATVALVNSREHRLMASALLKWRNRSSLVMTMIHICEMVESSSKHLRYFFNCRTEPKCGKHETNCGGDDHQCVSHLFYCDGHKDCRNGDDEKHCGRHADPSNDSV